MTEIPQFKTGRRPAQDKPALAFSSFMKADASQIPPHPFADDDFSVVTDWQMLGNDVYGDCVAVTWANERHAINKILLGNDSYPTFEQVIELYKTQNPNFPADDNGMYVQQCLEYLLANGGPDGVKPLAFAKVDHTNLEQVKAAIAIFGMVWIGLTVRDDNMHEYYVPGVWDYHPESANPGGHSVVAGSYSGNNADDVRIITWAKEVGLTDNYWQNEIDECWVVIWPEQVKTSAFQAGVDVSALSAAYTQITGRPLPVEDFPVTPEKITRKFTPEQFDLINDWAHSPHVWRKATAAAKAWKEA